MDPLATSSQIYLVFSSLAAPRDLTNGLRELLSPDELQRASRFRFEKHQTSFIVARGLLRIILSKFTQAEPAAIRFRYGPRGKPAAAQTPQLRFNVSHSEEMVFFGFRWNFAIGVDVEHIRLVKDMNHIARCLFCPAEYRDLLAIPREQQSKAFFDCWTRKEAFVKALGDGLSYPLDRFQVTLRPNEGAAFVNIDGLPGSQAAWSLHDVAPSASIAAAVASEGPTCTLQLRNFETPQACADFYR